MGEDLIRNTKSQQADAARTEINRAKEALVQGMLFGTQRPSTARGQPRVILGLDCTSSMGEFIEERRVTPEAARVMADALFAGRRGLAVQLAFFRGDDQFPKQPRQFRISNTWYSTPEQLARAIAAIEHWPGWTQHCPLLRHAVAEAEKQAVQEVVLISDAFEQRTWRRPHGDDLMAARIYARRLRELGVKIVAGYKGTIRGGCPLDRAGVNAEQAFRVLAEESGGWSFLFTPAALAQRFAEIGAAAALAAGGDAAGTQALLEHVQSVHFEMTVAERVPSRKCQSES
jgi:hypothetical protein